MKLSVQIGLFVHGPGSHGNAGTLNRYMQCVCVSMHENTKETLYSVCLDFSAVGFLKGKGHADVSLSLPDVCSLKAVCVGVPPVAV